jgi:hypothetical protein
MGSGRALLGIWGGSTEIGLVVGERAALDFWGDPLPSPYLRSTVVPWGQICALFFLSYLT